MRIRKELFADFLRLYADFRISIPQSPLATAPERGEKDLRDFLDMVSLRILAKGSETAPFGAARALLSKRAERLPYKIQQRFFDELNKWEPLSSFAQATYFATEFE